MSSIYIAAMIVFLRLYFKQELMGKERFNLRQISFIYVNLELFPQHLLTLMFFFSFKSKKKILISDSKRKRAMVRQHLGFNNIVSNTFNKECSLFFCTIFVNYCLFVTFKITSYTITKRSTFPRTLHRIC